MTLQVENDEPVLVNIGSHGPSGFNEKLGALRVIDCYDEKYLVAHSIANGESIRRDPTLICSPKMVRFRSRCAVVIADS